VIVLVIDDLNIRAGEAKSDTPVTVHSKRPMSFKIAAQRMKKPAVDIEVIGRSGIVQSEKLQVEPRRVARLNARLRSVS
jgi:hypothetical protein